MSMESEFDPWKPSTANTELEKIQAKLWKVIHTPTGQVNEKELKEVLDELGTYRAKTSDELAAAVRQGKITEAMRPWAEQYVLSDPDGFREFLKVAPVLVTATAAELELSEKLGVSKEQLLLSKSKQIGRI